MLMINQSMMGIGEAGVAGNPYFATTLYTGNGGTQSVVTGKNNAGGSLVWIKNRSLNAEHVLTDTVRGATKYLGSQSNTLENTFSGFLTSFNSGGFSVGGGTAVNANLNNIVAWSFLEAAGFFDIVAYTGTGGDPLTLSHNLGVEVGCIMIKRRSDFGNWRVYHRSLASGNDLILNSPDSASSTNQFSNPTISNFGVRGGGKPDVNANGGLYIAYLFAHNPSNGIACGSFTTDGSGNATVNVGFRPQFVLYKPSAGSGAWIMTDNKRGSDNALYPNVTNPEDGGGNLNYTSTGFETNISGALSPSLAYIYIAIR